MMVEITMFRITINHANFRRDDVSPQTVAHVRAKEANKFMIKSSVGSNGTRNVRINSGPAGSLPFVKNARVGRAPVAKVVINSALARSVTAKTMTLLPSTFSKSRVVWSMAAKRLIASLEPSAYVLPHPNQG
jgi:hypothetical protein